MDKGLFYIVLFNRKDPWFNRSQKGGFYEGVRVQMRSSLVVCKRKANEIDDERDVDKVFGIAIDARG